MPTPNADATVARIKELYEDVYTTIAEEIVAQSPVIFRKDTGLTRAAFFIIEVGERGSRKTRKNFPVEEALSRQHLSIIDSKRWKTTDRKNLAVKNDVHYSVDALYTPSSVTGGVLSALSRAAGRF